jgi:alpha-1,3-mannosyl-glycoprotein beta-1,2-N-acetylglucosaminyltransferase
MRLPVQRKDRACIRPEVGRTKTFGKIGVSNGLFFDKHLKFIQVRPRQNVAETSGFLSTVSTLEEI